MARPIREHPNAQRIAAPAVRAKMLEVIGKRLQRADAQDVMQRAYMRLLTILDQLPADDDELLAFVVVVTRGQIVDHHRRGAVRDARHADESEGHEVPERDGALSPEQRAQYRTLSELAERTALGSREHADCLRWAKRLAHGDTYPEIARDEGIPEATLRKRMERFREYMRGRYGQAGLVLAFLVIVGGGALAIGLPGGGDRDKQRRTAHPTQSAAPSATPAASSEPTAPLRAQQLLDEARDLCRREDWDACQKKIDEAHKLWPDIENQPDVPYLRDQIEYHQHMLPNEPANPQ
jgi:RNA polymerase sigma factor (sigma-70 family)